MNLAPYFWIWVRHRDMPYKPHWWMGASSWRRNYESETLVAIMPLHLLHALCGRLWFWWRYPIGSSAAQKMITKAYQKGYGDAMDGKK